MNDNPNFNYNFFLAIKKSVEKKLENITKNSNIFDKIMY